MITYIAINTLNGKFYIGSTTNFSKRKRSHLSSKDNYPFQNALRNNPDAFEWVVWNDESSDSILEQALLDMWCGKEFCYNLSKSSQHPPSALGKRMWVNSEGVQTLSAACPGDGWSLGVNDIRRAQNSKSRKGKRDSDETRDKKSKSHLGKKRSFSEEHKANLSTALKGISRGREGGLVSGKLNADLGRGICNPDYINSVKGEENRAKASLKGAKVSSKPVEIEFPNGIKSSYPSLSSAARETGLTSQSLGVLARSGKVGQKGDYAGIKVCFVKGKTT